MYQKEIRIDNLYTEIEIKNSITILKKAGIEIDIDKENIICYFDCVNIKMLEFYLTRENNKIISVLLNKLRDIKSYSPSSNGKIVYASFNKDNRVQNKRENSKKRLAYEYYKKQFKIENNILSTDILDKIYCDDSFNFLKKLPDNCIDIILTSPPYNFGINYNSVNDVNKWGDYFKKLFNIFKECIRVIKSTGRIIINIQPMYSDYLPTHHFISNFFIQQGMIWKGEILWEKNNYNCKYCTWGSWKSPSSPYLKYSWEFIEIFCKNSLKKEGLNENIDISADEFKKFVYGKWSIAPERRMKEFGHSAMFPEVLVERCLKLFSYKNDIILDPFNGVGTTTKVAMDLNRHFIGIDIDPIYCETAKKRLQNNINLFNN